MTISSTSNFPKILVIAPFPPGSPGGSGWWFEQQLRDYPRERISWWSAGGKETAETPALVSAYCSGKLHPRLLPQIKFKELKSQVLEKLWEPYACNSLIKFARKIRPDLLWVLAYSSSIPVLNRVIPKLGIPYHMTVHDFADTTWFVRSLGEKRAASFQKMVETLYTGATSRDVYMHEIDIELKNKTGCSADAVIRCGVEPGEFDYIRQKEFKPPQDKIRIGYPGTIVVEKTFSLVIQALQLIRNRLPLPVEVHLFGVHDYRQRDWFDPTLIVQHGYLSEDELRKRFRACDWGLALMDLDDSNPRYSRMTFPCKFTGALAAGLPVISVAHKESTLAGLASKYKIGPVITSDSPEQIAENLLPFLSQQTGRELYRDEILRCAEVDFNALRNRQLLHGMFKTSAGYGAAKQ